MSSNSTWRMYLAVILLAEQFCPAHAKADGPSDLSAQHTVKLPALGTVKDFYVTKRADKAVLQEWSQNNAGELLDRILVLDISSGKIERVLSEIKGSWNVGRLLGIDDSQSAALIYVPSPGTQDEMHGVSVNIQTGAIRPLPNPTEGPDLEERAAQAGIDPQEALVWVPIGKPNVWLVAVKSKTEKVTRLLVFDAVKATARLLFRSTNAFDLRTARDGSQIILLIQGNPQVRQWTSIEVWNTHQLRKVNRFELKKPLATIDFRVSKDGKLLIMHEYLQRRLLLFNVTTGDQVASIGPKEGGCLAFDLTADGRRIIALIGKWTKGVLVQSHIAVYSIDKYGAASTR